MKNIYESNLKEFFNNFKEDSFFEEYGINDLAAADPDIAADWHPTKNLLKSSEVTRVKSTMID